MRAGTNGRAGRPSGNTLLSRLLLIAVPVGVIVQVSINAMSRISDSAALGAPFPAHIAWELELTSGLAILLLLPAIWAASGRLRPKRIGWPLTITGHAAASVAFSLLHVALMSAMRLMLWGREYVPAQSFSMLFYEYRKDAWTYALIAMVLALARLMAANASGAVVQAARAPRMLLIQDGTRRHHIPIDRIDFIEAAGNYVEVVTAGEHLLHRATLAAVATELDDTFVRIHRGRLVRRAAIRLIETNRSGDFELETVAGDRLKGSRRYRERLGRIND